MPKDNYFTVAGWMIILTGVLALINGAGAILGEVGLGLDFRFHLDRYSICGALIIVVGLIAIVGGVSAVIGKHASLAFAGAACGIIGDGYLGFLLGLAALVLLFLSSQDL
jgi:hypothetical protein